MMMTSLETLKISFALDIKLFDESVSRDIGTEGMPELCYSASGVSSAAYLLHSVCVERFES
jgi:hypothetical protein